MSIQLKLVEQWIRFANRNENEKNIFEIRDDFSRAFKRYSAHPHVKTNAKDHFSPDGTWFSPNNHVARHVILYFHGGGMCFGSEQTHSHLVSQIAHQCQMRLFFLRYHLSPEFQFPRALEDALKAYDYLISSGYDPKDISLAADSSGALLALGLCQILKKEKAIMPNVICLMAPATSSHICFQDDIYSDWSKKENILNITKLRRYANAYLGKHDPMDPLCSPVYANLSQFPPIFSIIGDKDILIESARQLHLMACTYGIKNHLLIQPNVFHGHYLWFNAIPEAKFAVDQLCNFICQNAFFSK
ncbi:MAG: alpha/beta hydrolase [Gammaproteobacteria bacterium]|jgi:monoterpene epsilon-lactone hydrolase|nr:alpha/beta hydrolase [Gammaproteobacteria bacterium]